MTTAILCAAIALVQTPTQRPSRTPAPVVRETIYVAVQTPPPTVNVQTPPAAVTVQVPSDWPTWVVGALGLLLVGLQLKLMSNQNALMRRQTDAMSLQTTLMEKQAALEEQQATWRRTEAISAFYRLAFDLKAAFFTANQGYRFFISETAHDHARQVFRQAPEFFAPLGDGFLKAISDAAAALEHYLAAAHDHNHKFQPDELLHPDHQERYDTVLTRQRYVGECMDRANQEIPAASRWTWKGAGPRGADLDHKFAAEYNTDLHRSEMRGRIAQQRRELEQSAEQQTRRNSES